jgi:hypothetical protein
MVIKFLCPSGHQLSAPENLAGKQGKCPKCGTAFVVPTLEELASDNGEEPHEGPKSDGGSAEPPATGPGSDVGGAAGPTPGLGSGKNLGTDVFVFLCPNGHKLNGPPSLKGKPGKCPHCGARFRIPSDEDLEEPEDEVPTGEAEQDEEIADGQLEDDRGGFNFDFGSLGRQEDVEEAEEYVDEAPAEPMAPPPSGPAALGYIVGRLWERREEGTELEIFMAEGEIVSPDRFSEVLSSSDYGVFAVQEGDGTYHISVIPWSAVRRIGMRKVTELGDDVFQ